mmetsp:Transcript_24553/g.59604  ORF Transcript_24553/g.59604 Transcript_24553/m.59604 type:complete len:437 (-) Transcript_24553:166-1476(-)
MGNANSAAPTAKEPDTLRFLTPAKVREVAQKFGTPTYVYDEDTLRTHAQNMLDFPNAYGLTVRYAMKASPNKRILQLFNEMGLHIDASSGFECHRAMAAGVKPANISLSSQQLADDFKELIKKGVQINCCSLKQLERVGQELPGSKIGIRFNPGVGSGGTNKTNVGGPSSSFGIWHGLFDEVQKLVEQHKLEVIRVHTHIGSGSDPEVWTRCSNLTLDLCRKLPTVTNCNLGGGYKIARMTTDKATDVQICGGAVLDKFKEFEAETGRKLHLEIEPGTYLVANACALVCSVQDKVATTAGAPGGHTFIKTDSGMTEILRPSLYGAQHPIVIVPKEEPKENDPTEPEACVVVGHCCESGDLLTPGPDDPEEIRERMLAPSKIGDYIVVESAGAYCSGMSSKNYNSFPEAPEVMLKKDGTLQSIRKKQKMEQIWQNEE